jgi:L-noviosyl transferase
MRFLFTTAPLHGHFSPLVPLAWACRAAGHEVLVATSENFVPAVVNSGLPVAASGPGIDVHDLSNRDSVHGIEDARYAHGEAFALMASRNLAGTFELVDAWRPDVLVCERSELAGPIVAAVRGIAHVELQWGVAELPEYRAAADAVLRPTLHNLGLQAVPAPQVTLNTWPRSVRLPHAREHLDLRHVSYDGIARVASWMLRPPELPRICLTLGTVLPQLRAQGLLGLVSTMLEGLAELECELVLAMDDEIAAELGPLPKAVRSIGRVPLSNVVGSCAVLIHHGGHSTSLTALAAGCPQVALPSFDDQVENAAAVVLSGAGLAMRLHTATADAVVGHCRSVLENPEYAAAAACMAQEIAAQPSPAEVVSVLEQLLPHHDRAPEKFELHDQIAGIV